MPDGGSLLRLVASDEPGPWWLSPLRAACLGASWAYGLGARLDRLSHQPPWRNKTVLPAPVIGVGNITVGGTGKTPLTMEVARAVAAMGRLPVIISRGYGRGGGRPRWVRKGGQLLGDAATCGDEPVLMAEELQTPVAVGADRAAVGRMVLEAYPQAVLVGDDMLQHHHLYRDLDIVAVDAARPLGNGKLLPRGTLRESPRALARAGLIVQTRAMDAEKTISARRLLGRLAPEAPVVAARHVLDGFSGPGGDVLGRAALAGKRVLAFCGLAEPSQFAAALERLGLNLAGLMPFADHHQYSHKDMAALRRRAARLGADCLVCTQKDRVKLGRVISSLPPLFVTRLVMRFEDQGQALRRVLEGAILGWEPAN